MYDAKTRKVVHDLGFIVTVKAEVVPHDEVGCWFLGCIALQTGEYHCPRFVGRFMDAVSARFEQSEKNNWKMNAAGKLGQKSTVNQKNRGTGRGLQHTIILLSLSIVQSCAAPEIFGMNRRTKHHQHGRDIDLGSLDSDRKAESKHVQNIVPYIYIYCEASVRKPVHVCHERSSFLYVYIYILALDGGVPFQLGVELLFRQ